MSANLRNMAQQSLKPSGNGSQASKPSAQDQSALESLSSTLAGSSMSASAILSSLSSNPEYNLLNKKEKKKLRKKLKKKEKQEKKRGDNQNEDSSPLSHDQTAEIDLKPEQVEGEEAKEDLAAMVEEEAHTKAENANALLVKKEYKPARSISQFKKEGPRFFDKFNYSFSCIDFPTPDLEKLRENDQPKSKEA